MVNDRVELSMKKFGGTTIRVTDKSSWKKIDYPPSEIWKFNHKQFQIDSLQKNLVKVTFFAKMTTEAKGYFAKHSDLSVQIQDKVDRLKALRDNWNSIGYMIDTFRSTTPDIYQKVQRSRNKTRTCHRVWSVEKLMSIISFLDSPFCDPMFKKLTQ